MRLAVFVSGNGSNLQCIIDAIENGILHNISIDLIVADRDCYAIERAKKNNISCLKINRKLDWYDDISIELYQHQITHIVLAGFLSIIPKQFCIDWQNKIINLHPSLLPSYGGKGMYGANVHKAVLENKEKHSGATVHFVTEGIDEGNIIIQEKCVVENW